jgi:hypothetical protein
MAGADRHPEVRIGLSICRRDGSLLPPDADRMTSSDVLHIVRAATPFQLVTPSMAARATGKATEHIVSTIFFRSSTSAVGPTPSMTHARRTSSPAGPASRSAKPV